MDTEEQAKKKTCPLSFGVQETRNGNGYSLREAGPWACMGSSCMAWRWASSLQLEYRKRGEPAPDGDGWKIDQPKAQVLTYRRHVENGFCGLAGVP